MIIAVYKLIYIQLEVRNPVELTWKKEIKKEYSKSDLCQ